MPSEQEISDVLDTLAEYVTDIGDRVTHAYVEGILKATPNEEIGPIELRGHRCISDGEVYYIAAHPELRGVSIAYHLSLTENIANELSHEHAEAILNAVEIDVHESDPRMLASSYLLRDADRSDVQAFRSYFKIAAGGERYSTNLNVSDSGAFEGYGLERMIFPYEDDFSIEEFNDAVTTIVSSGSRTAEIIRRNVNLIVDEDEPANTEIIFGN